MMRILIFIFFIYDSKVPLDPIGDAEIIIMMTVGDAEDAR